MFGGVKGKFNGLELFQEGRSIPTTGGGRNDHTRWYYDDEELTVADYKPDVDDKEERRGVTTQQHRNYLEWEDGTPS